MNQHQTSEERDETVLQIYERLLEIEQRLIPTGLHTFGRPPDTTDTVDLLFAVSAFARPELGLSSLPNLVATGLGLPRYEQLLEQSAESDVSMHQREEVETICRRAIQILITPTSPTESRTQNREPRRIDHDRGGPASHFSLLASHFSLEGAAAYLSKTASVPPDQSQKVLKLLGRLSAQLSVNPELDALMRALRGEYIEPGPGADLVQNPNILPTGRNTHAVNPYGIPSPVAVQKAEPVARSLLDRHRAETGRYPETIGMVLWGMDNIKTQGEGVAQVLWLLGVRPARDAMNRVASVEVIPLEQLGRPRIDVVMTLSGIFRDLFGATMSLLDTAVRQVAGLDEPPDLNFVKKHVDEQMHEASSFADAATRLFSNAPGNYGANVNFMVLDSQWEEAREIGDLFVTRKSFAYGRRLTGDAARVLMERALARVEMTYQNLDNSEIGISDVDHYFEYLGGLSQAVEARAGRRPQIYLNDSLMPSAKIRTLEETVRLESRTKLLNPKWIEGMLKHGFRGVAEIENHVSNTFGWSATSQAVDNWIYDEIAGTYILDEQMFDRLRSLNTHATHNLIGRLLEAHGRGFWATSDEVIEQLRDAIGSLEDQLEGVSPGGIGQWA